MRVNLKQSARKIVLAGTSVFLLFSVVLTLSCRKSVSEPKASDDAIAAQAMNRLKSVDLQMVADNFTSPVGVVAEPGSERLFVIDQVGKIWIIDKAGNKIATPFIDIASRMISLMPGYDERGLLGLAFHPNYASNRKFYLFYTAPPPPGGPTTDAGNTGLPKVWNNTTRISEFLASSSNANVADMDLVPVFVFNLSRIASTVRGLRSTMSAISLVLFSSHINLSMMISFSVSCTS